MSVFITGADLTFEEISLVSREGALVFLHEEAKAKIAAARSLVERLVAEEKAVYGINTGFGKFCDITINKEQVARLQRNLIVSHACGVGAPLSIETVRALMLLRANALAKGSSGIKESTVQCLLDFLNHRVHPVVPAQGSLGASGDLAPLAHAVLVMIGEGEAEVDGEIVPGSLALARRNLQPIDLGAKEGLALINGTQAMGANLSLAVIDALQTLKTSFVTAALSHQALRGITAAFDARVSEVRPHRAQALAAEAMRRLLAGSEWVSLPGEFRVQDAYSLRCIPQVHGASWHAIGHVAETVLVECNSATDNPLVFPEENEIISAGNFHGQFLALGADYLAMAVAELASIAERRIERLVNPHLSGLPAFLTRHGGLNSGYMIAQYTAAALVSENKVLCHPASVDSIPSSANQEDHVSMGGFACRKVRQVIENTMRVLGIELLVACQAIDLQGGKMLSPATRPVYDLLRSTVPALNEDRVLYPEFNYAYNIINTGQVQSAAGEDIDQWFDRSFRHKER
ncbi:MAG: Histidine ammonia-lyase [Firmicutes bacterium]|nr:Histidine ammonia-lyase [Bacillota bacterium]